MSLTWAKRKIPLEEVFTHNFFVKFGLQILYTMFCILYPNDMILSLSFEIDFIYLFIFRERRKEGKRERNINVWEKHQLVASLMPPTGDQACNPGMCPDWESNWQPLSPQAGTQSTEPHQPGPDDSLWWKSINFFAVLHSLWVDLASIQHVTIISLNYIMIQSINAPIKLYPKFLHSFRKDSSVQNSDL